MIIATVDGDLIYNTRANLVWLERKNNNKANPYTDNHKTMSPVFDGRNKNARREQYL